VARRWNQDANPGQRANQKVKSTQKCPVSRRTCANSSLCKVGYRLAALAPDTEYAIKALADLRNVIGGTSSAKGIHEYRVLLSVCQTCKYKGVDFLEFVRSRERNVDSFAKESKL